MQTAELDFRLGSSGLVVGLVADTGWPGTGLSGKLVLDTAGQTSVWQNFAVTSSAGQVFAKTVQPVSSFINFHVLQPLTGSGPQAFRLVTQSLRLSHSD